MGRPSKKTDKAIAEILDRLAQGQTLRSICRDDHLPAESTVRGWCIDDAEFFAQYARSRDMGLDAMADEILDIADEHTDTQAARLRVDSRKWYLCKLAPKRYGDKVEEETSQTDQIIEIIRAAKE